QPMHRLQITKELCSMRAHRLRGARIYAVTVADGQHALPPIALELLVCAGSRVLFGQHLRQDTVAQSEVGVAEPTQSEMLQQLRIHLGAGHDDLRAPWPDSRQFAAVLVVHLWQFRSETTQRTRFSETRCVLRKLPWLASGSGHDAAGLDQCGGS